jgi:cell wall-associated NlpC family hydrolase
MSRALRAVALSASGFVAAAGLAGIGVAGTCPDRAFAEPDAANLDRQLATARQQLETVVTQFDTTRAELNSTQAELANVDSQLAPLNRQVEQLQDTVAAAARGGYQTTTADGPVNALLTTESSGALFDRLTTLDHIARGRQHDIEALRAAIDTSEARRRALTALMHQQAGHDRELSVTKAAVESALEWLQASRTGAYDNRRPTRAARGVTRGVARIPPGPGSSDDLGGAALQFAYRQMGKSYQWAAAGPNTYDCSGLMLASWRSVGRSLPHSAAMQWNHVRHIPRDQLRAGDLVFYYRDIHHVAMYAGDGRVIEAPRSGLRVSIRSMDFAPVVGYGRVD